MKRYDTSILLLFFDIQKVLTYLFLIKSTEICFHIFIPAVHAKYWCHSSNPDACMYLLTYPLLSLEASLKLEEQTGPVCTHRTPLRS